MDIRDRKHMTNLRRVSNQKIVDTPLGFITALAVHAGLFFGLLTVFQWHTEPEEFYAELWAPEDASGSNFNGKAAESEAEEAPVNPVTPEEQKTEPPKPEEAQPEPEPQEPQPTPEEIAQAQAQAAEAKAAEEQAARDAIALEEKRIAEEKEREVKRKIEEQKKQLEKERIERQKRRAAEQKRLAEEVRRAELARITGAPITTSGRVGTKTGNPDAHEQNLRGSLSVQYTTRVIACIRPHIVFAVPANITRGTHQAVYSISLLPDGSQSGRPARMKSSGLPAFDDAVERAIRRCNPFPRPTDGATLPRSMQITFDPVDAK